MRTLIFIFLLPFLFYGTQAIAQWQPTDGPYESMGVGDVSQYAGIMIASTECGIFTGTPSGNWIRRSDGYHYKHLLVDSLLYLYSGTGRAMIDLTDPGLSVQKVSNKSTLAMASVDSLLFFGNYEGVLYSDDGGVNMHSFNTGLPMDTIVYPNAPVRYRLRVMGMETDTSYIFIATERGVYRSDHSYTQWEGTGISSGYVSQVKMIGNQLYALKWDSIFRSNDHGDTWSFLYQAPSRLSSINGFQGNLYISTYDHGILSSASNGSSWHSLNAGFNLDALWNGAWFTKVIDSKLYAGSLYDGLYELRGSVWHQVATKGMYCNNPKAVVSTGNALVYAGNYRLFTKKNTGGWEKLNPFLVRTFRYYDLKADGKVLYAVADEMTSGMLDSLVVMLSKDEGQTWEMISDLPPETFHRAPRLFVREGSLFIGGQDFLYRSLDTGKTWQNLNLPLSFCWSGINDVEIHQGDIYVINCRSSTVFRYKAGVWQTLTAGLGGAGEPETFIKRDSVLMLSSKSALYRNVDGELLWHQVGSGLPQQAVLDYTHTYDRVYVHTATAGVHYSEDYGVTWHAYSNGLPATYFAGIDIYRDTLYLATGLGVFKHAVNPVAIGVSESGEFSHLPSLYPNPAVSHVVIKTAEDQPGTYTLSNSSGRLVRSADFHSGESLELGDLPAGVYIIGVTSEGQTYRQKLVVQ